MHQPHQPHELREVDINEKAASVLADVPFSTELGRRLAIDARRVASGKLDRETFHRKYHFAMLAEFGIDERASKPAGFDDE